MSVVHFKLFRPSATGDDVPQKGHLEVAPWKRRHLDDDTIVVPASFTVRIGAAFEGHAAAEGNAWADLAPTQADWVWQITERFNRGITRYVAVPQSAGVLEYADLIDVDPETLEPDAEPEAAWWAAAEHWLYGTVDPDDPDVLILHFPAFMLDQDDELIVHIPILEGA